FWETYFSFLQDGFDESGGAGIGTCRRAGRRGGPGGRANGGARASGTRVALPTRGRHLCDAVSAAKAGAGTGSAADDDGGTLRALRGAGRDGTGRGLEVAERPAHSREKSGRHPDRDARGTRSG